MKLWIPRCGNAMTLLEDWIFNLHSEYRNKTLEAALFKKVKGTRPKTIKVSLPKGTVLVCDRVYIRQSNKRGTANDFDSVTFLVGNHADDTFIGARFWVKLDDANTIVCDPDLTKMWPTGFGAKNTFKRFLAGDTGPSKSTLAKKELDAVRNDIANKFGYGRDPNEWKIDKTIRDDIVSRANAAVSSINAANAAYTKANPNQSWSTLHQQDPRNLYHSMNYPQTWKCKKTLKDAPEGEVHRIFEQIYNFYNNGSHQDIVIARVLAKTKDGVTTIELAQ